MARNFGLGLSVADRQRRYLERISRQRLAEYYRQQNPKIRQREKRSKPIVWKPK